MSANSKIEWTDHTWSPVRGCNKISPGCKNCYAETFAERWRGIPGHPFEQGFDLRLVPHKLREPLSWKKPARIFVCSMSDLFHDDVPNEYIAAVFAVMNASRRHTFQVLTKRADRMERWMGGEHDGEWYGPRSRSNLDLNFSWIASDGSVAGNLAAKSEIEAIGAHPFIWPLPNVHIGVSVEDRKHGLPRIDHLRNSEAALRFLSIEPLLEDLGEIDLRGIGWVIVGGESGHGARPFFLDWARSIVTQCRRAKVPVFVKQLGAKPFATHGTVEARLLLDHKKGADAAEWPEDLRVQEFP